MDVAFVGLWDWLPKLLIPYNSSAKSAGVESADNSLNILIYFSQQTRPQG
jgi:hypothetical protein